MKYRKMPSSGDELSILGFGCMRFTGNKKGLDEQKAIEEMRYAIDNGVNYMDTAWPYLGGKSEALLSKALKHGYREKVKIADKLPQWLCKEPEDADKFLDQQLDRLDVEYIDYYLIHALNGKSWDKIKELGVFDFIERAKKEGKIKNSGFSFHGSLDDFKRIIDDYEWDFCQIQLNILDTDYQAGLSGLEYARDKGIGVIVMEPLRGGSLARKLPTAIEAIYDESEVKRTNAEWALRWVWDLPGVILLLSGMNDISQIEENIKIASNADIGALTGKELDIVKRAADKFKELQKVPCTACNYCMPCPYGVKIPSVFFQYNTKHLFKEGLKRRLTYLRFLGGFGSGKAGLASQCVNCGACVPKCPQNIDIPVQMKKVKKDFEGPFTGILKSLIKMQIKRSKKKKKRSKN